MTIASPYLWCRRAWLATNFRAAVGTSVFGTFGSLPYQQLPVGRVQQHGASADVASRIAGQAERADPAVVGDLAQRAVEAARAAGAIYADARVTRIVSHTYGMNGRSLDFDDEVLGVGVRVLVNGYWGFAASPFWEREEVVRLAQDAVAQATDNARGTPRSVELGRIPVAMGTWSTPVRIDPFTVPVEEKVDFINYWFDCAARAGLAFTSFGIPSNMQFVRQERTVATSEGALFTQNQYESGGTIVVNLLKQEVGETVQRIEAAGLGWERFLDAKIPEQFFEIAQNLRTRAAGGVKVATVGRYTLVCDGATMAALVDRTWGIATQVDRALGYEANAKGTSILNDPLAMLGEAHVASPLVSISANRSAATQLATVKWDDEGVTPEPFPLIKDGVLVDFQTTREQAAWLAPYYQRIQRPMQSHGCAAAESALTITMQHMPNLTLDPSASTTRLDDLVANVNDGMLIENGVVRSDFQVSGGMLYGNMREIKHGRLGPSVAGGAVFFSTRDLWKNVTALGGPATQEVRSESQYMIDNTELSSYKGQPAQATGHSVSGAAATIANQPLIIPSRKA